VTLIIYTAWTIVLFCFAVIAFFGVRHASSVFGFLIAAVVASILVVSGFFAFGDMAHVWSGYPATEKFPINMVTLGSFVVACLKAATWVVDVRGA